MDRFSRTADIIKAYYSYKRTSDFATFIKKVCNFFDYIKDESLSASDLNLLLFLANEAGIPQYYDLLKSKFTNTEIIDENINVLTLSSLFHDSSLIKGDTKLHRYQKHILEKFEPSRQNRYVLTAPTSFGKTFLIYEVIQKMKYNNILLIFPTISLLSENYTRICESKVFSDYSIHSLSEEVFDFTQKNIFIFTPERFLSFMDLNQSLHFDFSFIDEIYKIDNTFNLDQETTNENERDTAYRLALEYICTLSNDMLLAGPYIELPTNELQKSFYAFANDNNFTFLKYNQFEIVAKEYITIKNKHQYKINNIPIEIGSISKSQKVANIIKSLSTPTENTIIYCSRRADTEIYAKKLLKDSVLISSFQEKCSKNIPVYEMFLEHLEKTYGNDWIVLKALQGRIGIHHSLIPKYIQKEIINLFNCGALICLFSTTTITEGVNTTAKNIIITSNKKGEKCLKQFDAKNIAGRAGRFKHHYSGRIIDLNNGFENIINKDPDLIEHKNYDINSRKTDVDYQITKDKYLTQADSNEKKALWERVAATGIPPEIFNCFKVIGPKDKLFLYNKINSMNLETLKEIACISHKLAATNLKQLHWKGFQTIMDTILPIVREEKLKNLISTRVGSSQEHSLVTVLLNYYLKDGFLAMVEYYTTHNNSPKTKDEAMRKVADYVYNVFKYHLVKYLGVFDIFYRYRISLIENKDISKIACLGQLLQKLEYNANSPTAIKLSDYGVPFKIINCYDTKTSYDKNIFDDYEKFIDDKISILFAKDITNNNV